MTETNAERILKIKHRSEGMLQYEKDIGSKDINVVKVFEDLQWLIQQAERALKLEDENNSLTNTVVENAREDWLLKKENARYKEALEFYAKDDSRGEKARQALGREKLK